MTKPPPAILLSSTDPTGAYMPPVLTEITGDTADALGVAGLEVECFMPYPSFAEMDVWGDDVEDCDLVVTVASDAHLASKHVPPATLVDQAFAHDGRNVLYPGDSLPPQSGAAPVGYRVVRAWYDDRGPDMGPGELVAWVAAWERDLASMIHECLLDRACSAAEQRAEMMAGGL